MSLGPKMGTATPTQPWRLAGDVHRQAAEAVAQILEADRTKQHGISIKSLTLGEGVKAKKATYAVTVNTLKHLPLLDPVLDSSGVLASHPRLSRPAALVLTYEILFGEGVRPIGGAERALLRSRPRLEEALRDVLSLAGVDSAESFLARAGGAAEQGAARTRTLRVNTLKASVQEVVCALESDLGRGRVAEDPLLPALLRLPPGTDLHDHEVVVSGRGILQSAASCMPAVALGPKAGWHVLDACAAPGNKTTHLAALVGPTGRVFAYDRDERRLATLRANAVRAGADHIQATCQDFLKVDAGAPHLSQVRAILLDPSCSGSGTKVSRMDHLLPSERGASGASAGHEAGREGGGADVARGRKRRRGEGSDGDPGRVDSAWWDCPERDRGRVDKLARFQETALRHALRFPQVRRVAYSTCSVYRRENEEVVALVLEEAEQLGFRLSRALPGWPRRGLPEYPFASKVVRVHQGEDDTDGFFVAVFKRRKGTADRDGT